MNEKYPIGVWVPYMLPWAEGLPIPETRINLIDGKWVKEWRYPVINKEDETDETDT